MLWPKVLLLLLLLRMRWRMAELIVRRLLMLRRLLQLVGWYELIAALSVLSHREVFLHLLLMMVGACQAVLVVQLLLVLLLLWVETEVVHAILEVLHAAIAAMVLHVLLLMRRRQRAGPAPGRTAAVPNLHPTFHSVVCSTSLVLALILFLFSSRATRASARRLRLLRRAGGQDRRRGQRRGIRSCGTGRLSCDRIGRRLSSRDRSRNRAYPVDSRLW